MEKAKKFTDKVVIAGLTNVDNEKTDGYKNDKIAIYNEKIKEIAGSQNIPFIDLFGILSAGEFGDGLHPNSIGHQKIFEKVNEVLGVKKHAT